MAQLTRIRIEVDNKQAVRSYQETGRVQEQVLDGGVKGANKLGSSIGAVTSKIVAMAGAYIGIRAVLGEVNKMAEAFIEKEDDYLKLGAAISIVGESWEILEHSMRNAFGQMQKTTRFSDNEMARAMQTLVLLTGSVEKGQENLGLAMDMASSGMWNLETSARYVAMALEGNYTMLSRYIPALRDLDAALGDTASRAEKTDAAMTLLSDTFGGLAEKQVDSTAGALAILDNQMNDLRASTGEFAAQIKTAFNVVGLSVLRFVGRATGLLKEYEDKYGELKDRIIEMDLAQLKEQESILSASFDQHLDYLIELERREEAIREIADPKEQQRQLDALNRQKELIKEQFEEISKSLQLTRTQVNILEERNSKEAERNRLLRESLKLAHQQLDFEINIGQEVEERTDMQLQASRMLENVMMSQMDATERINYTYDKLIDQAMEMGDIEAAMILDMARERELALRTKEDELDLQKELTQTQLYGAQMVSDVMYEAMGGAFDNIERMFINMIKRMIAEALVLAAIMALIPGINMAGIPGFGGGKFLAGLFGLGGGAEGEQYGGDVSRGRPYIVGEQGRELFVPNTDGYVVPNPATNSMMNTDRIETLLMSIESAIYGTALTDVDIAKASESGSYKRNVI